MRFNPENKGFTEMKPEKRKHTLYPYSIAGERPEDNECIVKSENEE